MKPLDGVELKLERAKEHLDGLKHEVGMFLLGSEPYKLVVDLNSDGPGYIARIKIVHPPPPRFGIFAGEIAHSVRSALDMIAWELAQIGPNPPPDEDTKTAFPICTEERFWDTKRTRDKIACIPQEAVEVIEPFQPYNSPDPLDHPLAMLQAIDNWEKHKTILVVGTLHITEIEILTPQFVTTPKAGVFEDGDEILRFIRVGPKPNLEEHFRAKMRCHIGFSKEGPGRGCLLGEGLEDIYGFVRQNIFPAIEKASFE